MVCPWGCSAEIMRARVAEHKLACPSVTLDCPIKKLGCSWNGQASALAEHKRNAGVEHFDLLFKYASELEAQVEHQRNKRRSERKRKAEEGKAPSGEPKAKKRRKGGN